MKLKNNSGIIRRADEGSFFNPATFEIYQMNETGNTILNFTEDEIDYELLLKNVINQKICTADELNTFIHKCIDKKVLIIDNK